MARRRIKVPLEDRIKGLLPGQGVIYTRESVRADVSESSEQQHAGSLRLFERLDLPGPTPLLLKEIHSASDGTREVYELLVAGIERGLIPWVICRDDDRLVRNPIELEALIPILVKTGVPIYFYAASPYDLATPDGRMMARMRVNIARSEVEKKSARQKGLNQHRAAQGKPFHTFHGFGYKWQGEGREKRRVQDPAAAKAVRWALKHLKLAGTCADVAREWNRLGLVNQRGGPWKWDAARKAMLNPALCGYRVYQPSSVFVPGFKRKNDWEFEIAEMIKGDWKPILSVAEWLTVRDILTKTKSQAGNNLKHFGSGMYECGKCATGVRLLSSHLSPKLGGRLVYRCQDCYGLSVDAGRVDAFVKDVLGLTLLQRKTYEAVFGVEDASTTDGAKLQAERDELAERVEALAESFAQGRTPLAMLEKSTARMNKRMAELDGELAQLSKQEEERRFFTDPDQVLASFESASLESQRFILASVFPKIVIYGPGKGRYGRPIHEWVHIFDRAGKRVKLDPPKSLIEQFRDAQRAKS